MCIHAETQKNWETPELDEFWGHFEIQASMTLGISLSRDMCPTPPLPESVRG